jgi:glycosyltransferase involved in cell wall biosynthesis
MNPFTVANPFRTSSDNHALALQSMGILRKYLLARKRLPSGIAPEWAATLKYYFLPEYAAAKTFHSTYLQEFVRFSCSPLFDSWVCKQLKEGDNLLAGFGYINKSLARAKKMGGCAFLESRNSHPKNFWQIVSDEYRRWGCETPPIPPFHHRRQMKSLELADYIFVPGKFIADSYTSRSFPADRILMTPLPVNTRLFRAPKDSLPPNKTFTIVSTGLLSLRKGSPYLLEAFQKFNRAHPNSVLKLVSNVADNFKTVMRDRFGNIEQVEWLKRMPHEELIKLLQQADLFVLPSLEEGMLLAAAEAMAVGIPVILTPNMGSADLVKEDLNGSIVPIRDSEAIRDRMEFWHQRWLDDPLSYKQQILPHVPDFSDEAFLRNFMQELEKVKGPR